MGHSSHSKNSKAALKAAGLGISKYMLNQDDVDSDDPRDNKLAAWNAEMAQLEGDWLLVDQLTNPGDKSGDDKDGMELGPTGNKDMPRVRHLDDEEQGSSNEEIVGIGTNNHVDTVTPINLFDFGRGLSSNNNHQSHPPTLFGSDNNHDKQRTYQPSELDDKDEQEQGTYQGEGGGEGNSIQ
ncbi:hypothetical protein OPQ81_011939 [Rhizoctonia solani]|nr:hypothetical protein OPQ81_011939 [Rhizoctonia solani]